MSSLWSTSAPTPSDGHASLRPHQRRIPREDDFWDALSNHYDYLMDDQLITSCREADYELSLCPDEGMSSLDSSLPSLSTPLPPFVQHCSVTLTAKQLVQKLQEVLLWLQEMEARIDGETNIDRQRSIARSFRNDLEAFNESKNRLLRDADMMSPSILEEQRSEVFSLSNQITTRWKKAEDSTRIHQDVIDNDKIFHDVKVDMRTLRRWLRDMEARLPAPKSVPSYWTLHDLKTKLENQKTIQAEIEAKGNLVKSLLRRCEQLRAFEGTNTRVSRIAFGLDRVARTVSFLEKRWQTLWLTSLEWQCLVEQLLDSQQDQPVATTPSISSGDTWDEPRNKLPRLDLTLNPRGLQEPRGIADAMEVFGRPVNDPKHQAPLKHKISNQDGAAALNQPFATQLKRPPSGNYEGGQDVGYSSESSTQLSTEEKPDLIRIYSFTPESTTPESPDMPSRDSGLSGGGSPRKFPLSSKCSPIDDTLKEVIDEDYISSPGIRISESAADFYTLTTPIVDSDGEAAKPTDLDDTLTSEKESCSPQTERHSVTIDDQVVQLRRKPASRLFAPLEFDEGSENNNNPNNKASRVKEWLQSCEQRRPAASAANVTQEDEEMTQQDSCDASGELTNESDSDDSDDRQKSTTTLNAAMSVETLATPTAAFTTPSADSETIPKVNLRSGQKRRSRDRPWSVTELQGQIGVYSSPKSALSTSTSMTALNDTTTPIASSASTTFERKRHSRASKAKESALSGSESEDNVSVATGTVHKRNSSTTSLINLCEAFPANTKEKTTPVRKKRLGSKILKAKPKCTGYSSANEIQAPNDQVVSDSEKKCAGDQGSVVSSDNMWDDYQDPLYYSEHYSEKEMDDETVKRLLNFGDDYRSFIGSTSDTSSLSGLRVRSAKKKGCGGGGGVRSEDSIRDSESEQEKMKEDQMLDVGKDDVNEMLNRSSKAFAYVSSSVKKCLKSNNVTSPDKLSEMEATCLSHLQCLQIIKIRISIAPDSSELLRELIERWQLLLLDIQSRDSKFSDGKLNLCDSNKIGNGLFKKSSHRDENVREDIDKLRDEMSQMEFLLNGLESLDDRSHDCRKFDERIAALKKILASLQPLKSSLLFVKVKVHRLAASKDDPQNLLTASVHDLYNTWDTLYERTCHSLTELQQSRNLLQNARRAYNPKITDLDNDESSLIYEAFTQMELCKPSVADLPSLSSAIHLSAMSVDQDYDSNYESGEETPQEGHSIWRIFKAALPFQVALVMLYCVAYLMEPHCCDVGNSWQTSFGPQLRYEQGHPPV